MNKRAEVILKPDGNRFSNFPNNEKCNHFAVSKQFKR